MVTEKSNRSLILGAGKENLEIHINVEETVIRYSATELCQIMGDAPDIKTVSKMTACIHVKQSSISIFKTADKLR